MNTNNFQINRIQLVNVVWVIGSFVLLYYGVTGSRYDLITSFVCIVLLFCIMYYMGVNYKIGKIGDGVIGEKAKGQWEER